MRAVDELAAAFMLLTRLPVGLVAHKSVEPARAAWAFPVVGAVVGLLGGAVLRLIEAKHLPPTLAAAWTLAALLLLTGALHEDGLADTADGFGGGRTVQRKLEIMRDSRIGSFGALALGISVALRVIALGALAPTLVIPGLIAAGAAARASMLVPMLLLPPARPDGLGASVAPAPRSSSLTGLLLAVLLCVTLLPVWRALAVLALTGGAAVLFAAFARRQVGGYTGDVLGAVEQIGECVALTILAVP